MNLFVFSGNLTHNIKGRKKPYIYISVTQEVTKYSNTEHKQIYEEEHRTLASSSYVYLNALILKKVL